MEQQPQKIERVKVLNEMPEKYKVVRENILKNFESKTLGLDIKRVKDFMKKQSLPECELVVFEDKDIPKLDSLYEGLLDVPAEFEFPEWEGLYDQNTQLALFRRKKNKVDDHNSVYPEAAIVHELAHGTSKYNKFIISEKQNGVPRVGFAFEDDEKIPWGNFLEEGFADMIRGEYLVENKNFTVEEQVDKKIRLMGFNPTVLTEMNYRSSSGIPYRVRRKYLNLDSANRYGFSHSPCSIAATSLEMLCEKIPTFRQTLIEARSDIKKLREIPKLINAIKPGLYLEIQKCDYSDDEFARVQNTIKEAIENAK